MAWVRCFACLVSVLYGCGASGATEPDVDASPDGESSVGQEACSSGAPEHLWSAAGLGGGAVAVDADGNLLIAGDPVESFGPDGMLRWQLPVASDHVAFDGEGKAVVAGHFTGTIDLDGVEPRSAEGEWGLFVAVYDTDGSHLWDHIIGGPSAEGEGSLAALAVDGDELVLAGRLDGDSLQASLSTSGSLDLGDGLRTRDSDGNVFVARYAPGGSLLWDRTFGVTQHEENAPTNPVTGIALDPGGNVSVVGMHTEVDLPGEDLGLETGSWPEVYVLNFAPDGSFRWAASAGSTQTPSPRSSLEYAVRADDDGNWVVSGGAQSFCVDESSHEAMMLFGMDAGGSRRWDFQACSFSWAADLALDAAGTAVVTGMFGQDVDLGGGARSASDGGAFVSGYDSEGTYLWDCVFEDAVGRRIATDASGRVIVSGTFEGSVDFGGGPLAATVDSEPFIAVFGPR